MSSCSSVTEMKQSMERGELYICRVNRSPYSSRICSNLVRSQPTLNLNSIFTAEYV